MVGRGQVRARWMAVALVGLLLAMCGYALSGQGAGAASSAGAAPSSGPAASSAAFASDVAASDVAASDVAASDAAGHAPVGAAAPSSASAVTAEADPQPAHAQRAAHAQHGPHVAHTPREQADDGAVDPGPSRCHKSQGDGHGTLPSGPSGSAQQSLPFVLAACLTPESHSALGAAHARPPVRGPAPAPPPTPVELSVLRV